MEGVGEFDWGSAINAGASIYNTYSQSRTAQQGYQSQSELMQLQAQADREKAEANQKLLKYGLIGGGVILVGVLAVIIISKS